MTYLTSSVNQKCYIYLRVSTQEQVESGLGLAAQKEKCLLYAQFAGLEVKEIVCDEGISGSVPISHRPKGKEMMRSLTSGDVKSVVALKLDRMFRDTVDALQTVEGFEKTGVAMHIVDMGGTSVNTSTAIGKFLITVLAGMAEFERNIIKERTRAALAQKKVRGEKLGRPLQKCEVRQHLEWIEEWYFDKLKSPRQIAEELNKKGITTPTGLRWDVQRVNAFIHQNFKSRISSLMRNP